tara:strand:- start:332 stop:1234 length:903 start_codon:yes stop_codon:yes gene_type:complete
MVIQQPSIEIPNLGASAMLVELNMSQWTARKKDKRVSKKVNDDHGATHPDASSTHKNLLVGCDELSAIKTATGKIRNHHYDLTMPWMDNGVRLLPTAQYFRYNKEITDMLNAREVLIRDFVSKYQKLYADAQARLGTLYNNEDYPTVEAMARKFGHSIDFIPMPERGDFRIDVGTEAMTNISDSYNDYYQRKFGEAMGDIWSRLRDVLSNMAERLDDAGSEKRKIFRDTLVSNVTDMIEMLRVCNITNDVHMTAVADKLDDALRGVTPDALREDAYMRAETVRAVKDVQTQINNLPSIGL